MAVYECEVCATAYDEAKEGTKWADVPESWHCPVCESDKSYFHLKLEPSAGTGDTTGGPATDERSKLFECEVCATIYEEAAEGVKWEDVPESWRCPVCESDKSYFHPIVPSISPTSTAVPGRGPVPVPVPILPSTPPSSKGIIVYECSVCGFIYDEEAEGRKWNELPGEWRCPVCESDKSYFRSKEVIRPTVTDEEPLIYACSICGFVYDEAKVGRRFKDLPASWRCPVCESDKSYFQPAEAVTLFYVCSVCGFIYDEAKEGRKWAELPQSWRCPVCESDKSYFKLTATVPEKLIAGRYPEGIGRKEDQTETSMKYIHQMAETGESVLEPMRSTKAIVSWDDILIKGAQLAKLPLNEDVPVTTRTVIGPKAKYPLVIESPVLVSHMSFGALSRECKISLAKGSAVVKTAMCSGEGGILPESMMEAYKYIFEYIPNRYSVTDENLKAVDAIEIKIGQSAKPGMGGHLPGRKVTKEIAAVRGFPEGADIISPAHYPDITSKEELKAKVEWLREKSGGKPIGIKFAAGDIEGDLEAATFAQPDFITIDGRPGATGAAPKFVKDATSVPTIFALCRARKYLDEHHHDDISLIITGGLRVSSDFAKALALGADAIAIGTAALMACGCQQYRVCQTGKCPMGITSQEPGLRKRINIEKAAERVANFLRVSTKELEAFARLTGNDNIHNLSMNDLCTINSEISNHTEIKHV